MTQMTPEQLERRKGARKVEISKPTLAMGVSLALSAQLREDETLTDQQKAKVGSDLPRNRAEARRLLKGKGTPKRVF